MNNTRWLIPGQSAKHDTHQADLVKPTLTMLTQTKKFKTMKVHDRNFNLRSNSLRSNERKLFSTQVSAKPGTTKYEWIACGPYPLFFKDTFQEKNIIDYELNYQIFLLLLIGYTVAVICTCP